MQTVYVTDVQVAARYGVHRATPWRWVKTDPSFPKPVKLSAKCSRWRLSDIEAWEMLRSQGRKP